jgi:outer membrane protein assembly factor BamE (lipoprotein component of BamABCDE complex)
LKPIPCLSVAGLFLLAGCQSDAPPSTPQAKIRRQTSAKLRSGMSEAEVATVLGQPTQFRPGNGNRDDVAVYRVGDQTFTIYFYQSRLTRYVSSQRPVNR